MIATAMIRFEFTSSTGTVWSVNRMVGRSRSVWGRLEVGVDLDAENYSQITRSDIDGPDQPGAAAQRLAMR